ncbi:metallopeptidase, putative [Bodo saltans]|uniref:Metallopeptidase, putative n=1 Tax=Bodo saltans TaxID=75058 RepID=A0A0S4IX58_BODSA|nr:metallopeptidase, putative [Bodo saltans]|eukprot:CUG06877.1 metallopeptidase, putative [Bodo saltans]
MGVLLGEMIDPQQNDHTQPHSYGKTARIWATKVIQRKDKRPDRVEIAPEHLYVATEHAEKVSAQCQRRTRVLGWYHSHPRITPYPSAVDLNCQAGFQFMESGWVGLIFSVFHSDSAHCHSSTIHAFQTGPNGTHEKVHMTIVPSTSIFEEGLGTCLQSEGLLTTFRSEISEYQQEKRNLCSSSTFAQTLVDGVAASQTYTLERLLGDNTRHYLKDVYLPELRRRVEELKLEVERKQTLSCGSRQLSTASVASN